MGDLSGIPFLLSTFNYFRIKGLCGNAHLRHLSLAGAIEPQVFVSDLYVWHSQTVALGNDCLVVLVEGRVSSRYMLMVVRVSPELLAVQYLLFVEWFGPFVEDNRPVLNLSRRGSMYLFCQERYSPCSGGV